MALACALFVAGACVAAPPDDLHRYAKRTLEKFDVPGMTVAIVEQGRPSEVRNYGVRRRGEPAKVAGPEVATDRTEPDTRCDHPENHA